jgi:hypothetical protein
VALILEKLCIGRSQQRNVRRSRETERHVQNNLHHFRRDSRHIRSKFRAAPRRTA